MSGVAYPPPNVDIFNSINYNTDFFTADEEGILSGYVKKTGSTMTGFLTINGNTGASHLLTLNSINYSTFPNIKLSAGNVWNGAIGFGGISSVNYMNNLFLESTGKIILNTNGNSISATPNFIIDTNGNVGIGLLNPSYKLDVNGVIYSSSTITAAAGMAAGSISGGTISTTGKFINSNTDLNIPTAGTVGASGDRIILYAGGTGVFPYSLGINTGTLWYSVPTGASHNFYTGGTSKMVIASTGKIGIGTAASSTYAVDIFTGGSTGFDGLRVQNGSANGFVNLIAGVGSNAGYIAFHNSSSQRIGYIGSQVGTTGYLEMASENGYNGYKVNSNLLVGNRVGIGSDVPQTSLDITNPTNPKIFLNQGGTTRCFLSGTSGGLDIGIDVGTSKTIRFMPDSTEKVRIDANGNVGIGTNNPSQLLDVYTDNASTNNYIRVRATANREAGIRLERSGTIWEIFQKGTGFSGQSNNLSIQSSIVSSVLEITQSGNVGIGTNNPSSILDIYGTSPKLTVRSATESQNSILYLGTPFTSNSALKCALIAEALTSFSRSKLHICLNNTNDNSAIYTAGIVDHVATFQYDGNVGIGNSNPMSDGGVTNFFNVGDASVANSIGAIVVGRRDNVGSTRQFRMGLLSDFSFRIGDFGSNNVIGGWTDHIRIEYNALGGALYLDTAGKCNSYGYITYSDIKLKTDIKTIDNALWKVQQLRGVYYKHITEGTDNIGLIAQEVEGIVPEAVSYNDKTDTKGVNYSSMVGLLINAIKEQQEIIESQGKIIESQGKTIENILSILSRNNIV